MKMAKIAPNFASFIRAALPVVANRQSPTEGEFAMFCKNIAVASVLAIAAASSPAFADGECGNISNAKKRMACIEKKTDELAKRAQTKDAAAAAIKEALTNVKIDWAAHPSVCLYFQDWTQRPERVTFAVQGCGSDDGYRVNIHK